MSTPATRGMARWAPSAALPLLVTRIGAHDADHAEATDDLAVLADAPDRCPDFHGFLPSPASAAVDDASLGEVVGVDLHGDRVARQDADVVHAHLPGDVGRELMSVLELHSEDRVG